MDTDALAADLEALAHAHPEIAGTLHLAATTLAEQKAEIKLLSEQITVVKGALSHFLEGLGTGDGAEGLDKEEVAALQVLQGIAATLLDELGDDKRKDDVGDVDMTAPSPPRGCPRRCSYFPRCALSPRCACSTRSPGRPRSR